MAVIILKRGDAVPAAFARSVLLAGAAGAEWEAVAAGSVMRLRKRVLPSAQVDAPYSCELRASALLPGVYEERVHIPFPLDVVGRVKGKVRICPPPESALTAQDRADAEQLEDAEMALIAEEILNRRVEHLTAQSSDYRQKWLDERKQMLLTQVALGQERQTKDEELREKDEQLREKDEVITNLTHALRAAVSRA